MGKNKYIESPEKMWEHFLNYAKETKANPRFKTEYVGKDGEMVKTPLERPLTIEGFECWCYDHDIIGDLSNYFANYDNKYSDYLTICNRIRKSVRMDQIEGGMVGQYNPSITQRLNGLVDKTESNVNTSIKLLNIDPINDTTDYLLTENRSIKEAD